MAVPRAAFGSDFEFLVEGLEILRFRVYDEFRVSGLEFSVQSLGYILGVFFTEDSADNLCG